VLVVYHVDARGWGSRWAERLVSEEGFEPLAFAVVDLPVGEFLAADRDFATSLAAGRIRSPFTGRGG
jgi:hypothetical protein